MAIETITGALKYRLWEPSFTKYPTKLLNRFRQKDAQHVRSDDYDM